MTAFHNQTHIDPPDRNAGPIAAPPAVDVDSDLIARLTAQLRAENVRIAELVERQRELRLELLRVQERKLASMRPARATAHSAAD